MGQSQQWSVPSNNGWDKISFDAQAFHEGTGIIEHRVNLTGKFWYRPAVQASPAEFDRIVDDYTITLHTVLIPRSACEELLSDLDRWLETQAPFVRNLSSVSYDLISLQVGEEDDSVTTSDHPKVTFYYGVGGCRLEVFFVVDQSCIRLARDELAAMLRSQEPTTVRPAGE